LFIWESFSTLYATLWKFIKNVLYMCNYDYFCSTTYAYISAMQSMGTCWSYPLVRQFMHLMLYQALEKPPSSSVETAEGKIRTMPSCRHRNRNHKLLISRAPTKAKSLYNRKYHVYIHVCINVSMSF